MAYNFHYTPTGTGVISGKEVLEQTEDAINDLGNTAISGVEEALDKAEQALTNSANAVDDAQTALNTANNADENATTALNTVNNLSGTVTSLGNRVTTAEGNISNLQGRMTTAESGISGLTTRMGTAEGNITTLQSNVSTAQATANSAQQTANTARQQSYILRYSSSSVTDNSTIAYSTLDNTDNIKTSDKIIDVDGKIFSVVSVDTANQTVTVGSALIDLALDANVVHTSGDESISGDKVFNNRLIKNIDVVMGISPSSTKYSTIDIADNNKASLAQFMCGVYNNGQTYGRLFIQNKTASDGTGLSPTGTLIGCGFNISLPADSTSDGQGSITPRSNKTTDFGLLSYQWRNLWCEKLFLNGTQLDPSAFVTTDTDQSVSGQKVFDDINAISTSSELGVSSGNNSFKVLDKNKKTISRYEGGTFSTGMAYSYLLVNNGSDVFNGVSLYQSSSSLAQLRPYSSTLSMQLGASNRSFSDCYTSKVNGLTPSSLSMPTDNASNIIDISSYITALDGSANSYQALDNGWIALTIESCSGIQANISGYWGHQVVRPSIGTVRFLMPICKNMTVGIYIFNGTLSYAKFIPCQGNV